MSARALLPLAAAALLLGGCFTLQAQVPGALRSDLDDEQVEVRGAFELERTRPYYFWGLLGEDEDLLAEELHEAVSAAGADGVANLSFEAYFSATDLLIGGVTLGLVSPRTYRFRGDLVRIDGPALPGRPLLDERRRRPAPRRPR